MQQQRKRLESRGFTLLRLVGSCQFDLNGAGTCRKIDTKLARADAVPFAWCSHARYSGDDPPDKPNPTPGAEGRADGFNKSSSGLSSKKNENYAPRVVFASALTALLSLPEGALVLSVPPNSVSVPTR